MEKVTTFNEHKAQKRTQIQQKQLTTLRYTPDKQFCVLGYAQCKQLTNPGIHTLQIAQCLGMYILQLWNMHNITVLGYTQNKTLKALRYTLKGKAYNLWLHIKPYSVYRIRMQAKQSVCNFVICISFLFQMILKCLFQLLYQST